MAKIFTDNEQLKIAVMNVTRYTDFEEYEKYNNTDKDEFEYDLKNGWTTDITLGTYNGALDIFTPRKIDDEHIIDAIFTELHETDFYNMGDDESWYTDAIGYTDADWIRDFSEFMNVFIIDNKIYVYNG